MQKGEGKLGGRKTIFDLLVKKFPSSSYLVCSFPTQAQEYAQAVQERHARLLAAKAQAAAKTGMPGPLVTPASGSPLQAEAADDFRQRQRQALLNKARAQGQPFSIYPPVAAASATPALSPVIELPSPIASPRQRTSQRRVGRCSL